MVAGWLNDLKLSDRRPQFKSHVEPIINVTLF